MKDKKTRTKMDHADPIHALDVLQSMLEKGNSPLAQDFKRYRLKLDWPRVVGPLISEKCSPVGFSNGILYIWVVNATWMNQLFFIRRELLKKVAAYGGKNWVRDIRFTQDRKDVPTEAAYSSDPQGGPGFSSPSGGEEPPHDQ